eukprot:GHVU01108895.1.p2 GENE.GHVU01108895.1~~GHVU01108895.1.p2  ORF type:complete len:109 (+),score=10.29 GHVU01108895.1:175-501(+)
MVPLGNLSIAVWAAQQRHKSSGCGVWGCGTVWEGRRANGSRRTQTECVWNGDEGEGGQHTHTYADSPVHAQPVSLAVPPLPLVAHGSIRVSEDTRGYTHSVATHTHTH